MQGLKQIVELLLNFLNLQRNLHVMNQQQNTLKVRKVFYIRVEIIFQILEDFFGLGNKNQVPICYLSTQIILNLLEDL